MELPLEGGCCCGAVRYTCSAAPQMIFNCHCKDCQKLAGGPCTTAVLVPTECLEIQGVLTRYTSTGDNGGKGFSVGIVAALSLAFISVAVAFFSLYQSQNQYVPVKDATAEQIDALTLRLTDLEKIVDENFKS